MLCLSYHHLTIILFGRKSRRKGEEREKGARQHGTAIAHKIYGEFPFAPVVAKPWYEDTNSQDVIPPAIFVSANLYKKKRRR